MGTSVIWDWVQGFMDTSPAIPLGSITIAVP